MHEIYNGTDRQIETERDRQTDRQRQRETEGDRDRQRESTSRFRQLLDCNALSST